MGINYVGQRANPFALSMTNTATVTEFTKENFRFELRKGRTSSGLWVWIRSTCIKGTNYDAWSTMKLSTPKATATGAPYGDGDNWSPGSIRCSEAIQILPGSNVKMTAGFVNPDTVSKTVY